MLFITCTSSKSLPIVEVEDEIVRLLTNVAKARAEARDHNLWEPGNPLLWIKYLSFCDRRRAVLAKAPVAGFCEAGTLRVQLEHKQSL